MSLINEAGLDRIIRIALGIALLVLGWADIVSGTWGTVFKWFGFVPLATGLAGWCPLYAIFGFHTNRRATVSSV
jgi:hypothetical protein